MKLTEVFPSNFIKAEDLQGRDVTVIISNAQIEKLGNDNKLVMYFKGKDKGLVCNKTNAGRISYLYGDDTDDWIGKPIVLTSEFVEFQGKSVKAIRVKPPSMTSSPQANPTAAPQRQTTNPVRQQAPQQSVPSGLPDLDDEIPF